MRGSFRAHPTAPSPADAHAGISPVFLKLLADEPLEGRTVLDVGTGRGRLALTLAPRCGRVVGIDRDETALADARRAAAVAGLTNVEFVAVDAEAGEYAAFEPDAVVAHLCMSSAIAERAGRALVPLHQVPRGRWPHPHARAPAREGEEEVTLAGLALAQAVKARALELGFDRVAIGPATLSHGADFERWLDTGRAGTMEYLAETRAERLDPARLLPGCRSVVAVALNYAREDDGAEWRGVARYARGADYHNVMRPLLHALRDYVSAAAGAQSRASVDTSAVLERDLAAAAGLGWVGKNTNLIAPGLGSYFFIGLVLTTADLPPDDAVPDRCGTCTACLDACPSAAFEGPYALDARRCVAYLTIEHRGPIPDEFHAPIGDWLFGCDVCQEVCPWNRHAPPARQTAPATPPPPPEALVAMTDAEFRERFRGSPLKRARRAGLARNAAIVLGNRRRSAS